MDTALQRNSTGATPDLSTDEQINRVIIDACKLNCVNPSMIEKYIPRKQGLRNTFAFQCLLHIYVSPRLTKTAYARFYKTCEQSTCHAVDYLLELGLIAKLGKPRLIVPFERYKVDTAYKITDKGRKVVADVLMNVGILKTAF